MSQSEINEQLHDSAKCVYCSTSFRRQSLAQYLQRKGYKEDQVEVEIDAYERGEGKFVYLKGKWQRLFSK